MKSSWKGLNSVSIFLLLFHTLDLQCVLALSPLWDSVTTNIVQEYDLREGNDLLTVRVNMGEYRFTDLIVGEDIRKDSRLILTCIAHHGPAEWVYSGDAHPKFFRNKTIENIGANGKRLAKDDMNGAKRYVATLILGAEGLSTKDTGRYNCMTASPATDMKYKTLSAFYHIYVPSKNKLFIRKSETVHYDLNKSAARIPCGVSNPKASVTVQKYVKGVLEFIPSESMLYHPISGYYPKKDIKGTYLCTAAFNNTFDFVHFTLTPSSLSSADDHGYKKSSKRPSYSSHKNPSKVTNPDDLDWLIYSYTTTKKPRTKTTPFQTQSSSKPLGSSKRKTGTSPYVPFHLRYSTISGRTTTYVPFQTFYAVQTTTSGPYITTHPKGTKITGQKASNNRRKPTKPTFITNDEEENEQKHEDDQIPEELISYKPFHGHGLVRPIGGNREADRRKKTTPNPYVSLMRHTRTTPRRYRPYTAPTTKVPVIIPESIICTQLSCGLNAMCYSSIIYNQTLKEVHTEPACKCIPGYMGNPYLNCYRPTEIRDPNLLLFNVTHLGRSPPLEDRTYNEQFKESSEDLESNNNETFSATSSVHIIDM